MVCGISCFLTKLMTPFTITLNITNGNRKRVKKGTPRLLWYNNWIDFNLVRRFDM